MLQGMVARHGSGAKQHDLADEDITLRGSLAQQHFQCEELNLADEGHLLNGSSSRVS